LINGCSTTQIKEIARGEYIAPAFGADPPGNSAANGTEVRTHICKINIYKYLTKTSPYRMPDRYGFRRYAPTFYVSWYATNSL